jgi:formate dehydrogenase (NADP+) beta subunit
MCRRSIEDDPVSINQLKRFVADLEMNSGKRYPIPCNPDTGNALLLSAVVPAGLTVAYFLEGLVIIRLFLKPCQSSGGMLRYGIPEYRLPKETLDWEIDGILNLGIDHHVNAEMGFDFDLGSLVGAGFDAVFWVSVHGMIIISIYLVRIFKGALTGIKFLAQMGKNEKVDIGKRAAVVGGGNTAIDCARTLVRMGLEKVYLVYRRTRKEMPANEVEIVAADHEGIEFVFLAAPKAVLGDENGRVRGSNTSGWNSGNRTPVAGAGLFPVEGSETVLDIDTIISAIGQNPELSFIKEGTRLQGSRISRWNTFEVNPETCQTNVPYIFAAGDSQTGPATVVEAIGGARRAARAMDRFLRGKPIIGVPNALLARKKLKNRFSKTLTASRKQNGLRCRNCRSRSG